MENVADALKIAAAVLIFVLALSISINAFGEARLASRTILEYKDREYDYTYVEGNSTERIVGVEDIVPSIYKAYKENYKIVFENISGMENGVYRKTDREHPVDGIPVYSIDLQNEVLGTNTQKEQFIMAVLYGNQYNPSEFGNLQTTFRNNLGIILNTTGIYGIIKDRNKGLKENLGIYYQEETPTVNEDGSLEGSVSDADVPDANKTTKRVITYSEP